ncbi:hypothetical protein ACUSIJ_00995 [Pseudochelatococcus sp. B33]
MTAKSLHDLYDELSTVVSLAEALGFIADGVAYGGHRKAGEAVAVVTSILLDRLKGLKADIAAMTGETAG